VVEGALVVGMGVVKSEFAVDEVNEFAAQVTVLDDDFVLGVFHLCDLEDEFPEDVLVVFCLAFFELSKELNSLKEVLPVVDENFVFEFGGEGLF
jgi:hypothetical protein